MVNSTVVEIEKVQPQWWNENVAKLVKYRRATLKIYNKFSNNSNLIKFKRARAKARYAIRAAQEAIETKEDKESMMVQSGSNPVSKQSMSEKKKMKKKKKVEQNDSDEGGDELDLTKELFSLSHYAGDPGELINQVFSTITDVKLTALLPPILKGINLNEVKHDCLHELSGMSKKRILCVINGQEMEGSSGSDEDLEEDEVLESPVKGKSHQVSLKRPIPSKEAAAAALLKKIKEEPVSDEEVQERDPVTGKSVMELLELEMRARIIKTMLDKGEAKGVLTEEMVSEVISGGKSPIKHSHSEKRKSMEDKENVQSKDDDDDDDVKIVESPDEKHNDRRHRRRRRHGSRSKHEGGRSSSNRRRTRSGRGEERGSRSRHRNSESLREDTEMDRSRHKNSESLREDTEMDKKKKKITRKEFEERMKRAKQNRKYRKRGEGSEEEQKEGKEKELLEEGKEKEEKDKDNKNVKETEETKEEGEEDGAEKEVSEREEGEWISNEEEEGECSVSGSSSYYSDFSDPGKSRGSQRRKSLSRSRSRSKSKSPSGEHKSSRRVPRVPVKTVPGVPVGTVKMPQDEKELKSEKMLSEPKSQTKKKDEEEENWGQKCDIEFVDSEEDFDGENGSKGPKKLGISFSLKKKVVPSINQKDIDDLPMKKRNPWDDLPDNNRPLDELPDKKKDSQILISSDSEAEGNETSKKKVKALSECQEIGEDHRESTSSKSLMIIPDVIDPAIDSKTESKESIASEEPWEKKSISEATGKNEKDKETDEIYSDELNLKNKIDNEHVGLQSQDIEKELPSDTKDISEETSVHKETKDISEETNVQKETKDSSEETNVHKETKDIIHKETDIPAGESIKESNIIIEKTSQVKTDDSETIDIVSNVEDKNIKESNEIISEGDESKNVENKEKSPNKRSKTKKAVAQKIVTKPEPRTTRRSTRASKKTEIEEKSHETEDIENVYDIEKVKKKQDKERKLAIENEKRILEFENEFEEPEDINNSEDIKSKTSEIGEVSQLSQATENKETEDMKNKLSLHKHLSEENSETKANYLVEIPESIEKDGIPKDSEGSIKELDCKNDSQVSKFRKSESSATSSKDIQLSSEGTFSEVNQPEELMDASALDLTICKNKEGDPSNQITSAVTMEVSNFYHPDTSASNSMQDFSLHTTKSHDMDDEEEIDVVGGVEDEEIDVVGGVDDDNIARMEDDNATTSGIEQFVTSQDYATEKDQNREIDKPSNIDDKTLTHESKKSVESPGDFYRGMDELPYSDEEKEQDEIDIEQLRNSHVEPIRIETGLIRKKVPPKQKIDDVQYPDKSWSKDRKRKEKTKDALVFGSIGSLCSSLPRESAPKSELLEEEESSQTPEGTGKDYNSDDDCSQDSSKCLSEGSKIMPEEESESRSSTHSKSATKEWEIIGEIEATTADNDEIDLGRSSWNMRWLQSEKVQKVVSSSKMLSRVRKKIQQKDKATKVTAAKQKETEQNETEQEKPKLIEPATNAVIGSIEEYERLFGKKTITEDLDNKIEGNSNSAASLPVTGTVSTDPSISSIPNTSSGNDVPVNTNAPQTSAVQQATSKVPIIDSDSEDDSEEDALWGQIMGK